MPHMQLRSHLSVGCHCPPVQPLTCPLVFFISLMYMSPLMNSPSSFPSLSYTFGCGEPVTTRNAPPEGDQLNYRLKADPEGITEGINNGSMQILLGITRVDLKGCIEIYNLAAHRLDGVPLCGLQAPKRL
jgi:hypothetical protein